MSRGCLYNYCYGAYFVLSQCSNLNHTARIRGVSLRFPCYNLTFHLLVATIRADGHHHLRVWSLPYTHMLADNSRKVFIQTLQIQQIIILILVTCKNNLHHFVYYALSLGDLYLLTLSSSFSLAERIQAGFDSCSLIRQLSFCSFSPYPSVT